VRGEKRGGGANLSFPSTYGIGGENSHLGGSELSHKREKREFHRNVSPLKLVIPKCNCLSILIFFFLIKCTLNLINMKSFMECLVFTIEANWSL
jgi:hypothetical protein